MAKDRNGAGRRAHVLVLREHDKGYSLELAPLAGSDVSPRARGVASPTEAASATATGTATATATGRRAEGSGQRREGVAGGAPSRPRRPRIHSGDGDDYGSLRARRQPGEGGGDGDDGASAASTAWLSRPRTDTTVAAAGGLRGGDGESSGSEVEDVRDDLARDAGDRILREMRTLLFSNPQDSMNTNDTNSKVKLHDREVLIPVFLSPKKKGKNNKDDIWNKRQIMYGIALLGLLGFVPAIVAFLPQWALFVFAAVWGVSSIGFPFGLYGTSKLETGYSRHMGRFVFMGFCLVVIFMLYQYMALMENSTQPEAISPPPSAATHSSARVDTKWTVGFTSVGVVVMVGHIFSWARGCYTGSDDDNEESESSGTEDLTASDLLQRLL